MTDTEGFASSKAWRALVDAAMEPEMQRKTTALVRETMSSTDACTRYRNWLKAITDGVDATRASNNLPPIEFIALQQNPLFKRVIDSLTLLVSTSINTVPSYTNDIDAYVQACKDGAQVWPYDTPVGVLPRLE